MALYQAHVERFEKKFQPVGERESQLVQSLADTQWRLNRTPSLEFGLFALGRLRSAELFAEIEDPQVRSALLDAHIFTAEGKHFSNLHRQEARLRRQYGQDLQELKALQARRQAEETKQNAVRPAAHGFELSTPAKQLDPLQSREQSDRLIVNAGSASAIQRATGV